MTTIEGTHAQRSSGKRVAYRIEYDVTGNSIHFRAGFGGGGAPHEGQFDFDPSHLDAEAAVRAFMQNHIDKSDWDVAP